MKRIKYLSVLLLVAALITAMTSVCYADDYKIEYGCTYNGSDIKTDFDMSAFNEVAAALEPGDHVTYVITYVNDSDNDANWYVKTNVFDTIDAAGTKGVGYTVTIKNSSPDKTAPKLLYDNMKAEAKAGAVIENPVTLSSATGEYYGIGRLKAGQSGKIEMYIMIDGDAEDIDYPDTAGKLIMQFAAENDKGKVASQRHPLAGRKTGNSVGTLMMLAFITAAILALLFAVISFVKDWKRGDRQ